MDMLLAQNLISLDIILIVFLLVFAIIGFFKGLTNYLLGFIGTVAAFFLAFLFCDDIVRLLEPTGFYGGIKSFFQSIFPPENVTSLEALGLPDFIQNIVLKLSEITPDFNISEAVSSALTNLLLSFASFILILLIVKLICFVLKKVFNVLNELPLIGITNKLLGCVVGLINGALIICAVIYLISVLQISALDSARQAIAQSNVASFLLKYNIYVLIFAVI